VTNDSGSALIIPLPTVDGVVGRWRAALDPSAALGVPAHVTIHFPWVPAEQVDDDVLRDLEAMVAGVAVFDVALARIGWFDREVVWLDPDPREPFLAVIAASGSRWPDWPLYGGLFETVVPHVTIGIGESAELGEAAAGLSEVLPIHDVAAQLWWMTQSDSEPWVVRRKLAFGDA
jgi:2'-5' RNA ligase